MEEIIEGLNKFISEIRKDLSLENNSHLVGYQHTGNSTFGNLRVITSEIWFVDIISGRKKLIITHYSGSTSEYSKEHNVEVYRLLFIYLNDHINDLVYNVWK